MISDPLAGELLREARGKMSLSLEDVAKITRVSSRYLEALELGDLTVLPSRVHALGFARAFARAVGADEEAVVNLIKADV